MSQKLTGRDLILEGWQPGPIMGAALDVAIGDSAATVC